MKRRTIISEEESKRILGLHESLKKTLLKEQNEKEELQKVLDTKCLERGEVVSIAGAKNPKYKFAIRIESTTNPGTYRWYFIDKRVGELVNGKIKMIKRLRWNCDQTAIAAQGGKDVAYYESQGYVKFEDLDTKGFSSTEAKKGTYGQPITVDIGNGQKVQMYKTPGTQGQLKGRDPDEQKVIDDYEQAGWEIEDKVPSSERTVRKSKTHTLKSGKVLTFYFNPSLSTELRLTSLEAIVSRQKRDRKFCRATLDFYYDSYVQKMELQNEPNFLEAKKIVQQCVDQYNIKGWATGLGSGNKYERRAKYMQGIGSPVRGVYPPSMKGETSVWRLK